MHPLSLLHFCVYNARICVADVGGCCFSLSTLMFGGEMRGFCV
jgi:hypothetical protein